MREFYTKGKGTFSALSHNEFLLKTSSEDKTVKPTFPEAELNN